MGLVDHHRFTVKAMAVELLAGFVCVFRGHLHKRESVANDRNRKNSADDFEKSFDGGSLRTFGEVSNQKFFCRSCCCHLNTYADE